MTQELEASQHFVLTEKHVVGTERTHRFVFGLLPAAFLFRIRLRGFIVLGLSLHYIHVHVPSLRRYVMETHCHTVLLYAFE